ncbi:MAG: CPBP family intramembrane metalloprotease [Lachnospiraceae bacterium]|nr:CPBP family intramembrane metalloprotease [Lachnospiraceae bacterium]
MNRKIIFTLLKKELTDIFRDTKTIIIMVIVPLILYPLVFLGSLLLTSSLLRESTVKTYNVAIVKTTTENTQNIKHLLDDALIKHEYHFHTEEINSSDNYEKLIRDAKYDVVIVPENGGNEYPDITIHSLTSSNKSSTARSMVDVVFSDYSDDIIEERLKDAVDNYETLKEEPFKIEKKDYSSREETTGMLIGYIMPFMMIISVLMGAFTVAIDISVGEKERGTLETLITLPISNTQMMISKFFAVTIFALFSVAINILSFALMGFFIFNSMEYAKTFVGDFKFTQFIPSILLMIVLLVLFTMFVSSVCLCVDFMAKSVKEANNLTTPLMLILMTGAGMSVLPGVKLNFGLALVPILNVSLLIKELFMLNFDISLVAVVFAATLIHTTIAIYIMTKVFSSENILFGEGLRSVRIFEKRANMPKDQIPGVGDIVMVFALMFLISNFAGGFVVLKFGFIGYAFSQLIIFLVPVLYALYMRADMKNIFSLEVPGLKEMVGVLFFVSGSYVFNTVLVSVLYNAFPLIAKNNDMLSGVVSSGGFIPALLVIGMMPAIAEEAAFRGFLYGTLKNKRIPILATIVITAVVFAAYHMNLLQFIYVTLMGLLMSYMIYNSKSIFVTAFFHLLNNSFSVVLEYHPDFFKNVPLLTKRQFEVKEIIIYALVGIALLAIGFFISDNKIGIFSKLSKNKKEG